MAKKTSQRNSQETMEEAALEGWEILKKYRAAIIGVALVSVAIVLGIALRSSETQKVQKEAWTRLFEVQDRLSESKSPNFEELKTKYDSKTFEPYMFTKEASELIDKGGRRDLERAKAYLEDMIKRFKDKKDEVDAAKLTLAGVEDKLAKGDYKDFKELRKDFPDSNIQPFVTLKEAHQLYQAGGKTQLEKARKLLKDLRARLGKEKGEYRDLIDQKIAAIDAELAHAPSWLPKKEDPDDDKGHDHDGDGEPDHDAGDHKDGDHKDGDHKDEGDDGDEKPEDEKPADKKPADEKPADKKDSEAPK